MSLVAWARGVAPYLLVLASAGGGLLLGSERRGLPADYFIDADIDAADIETLYAPALQRIAAVYAQTDATLKARAAAELTATLRADPAVLAASLQIRPLAGVQHWDFAYQPLNVRNETCVMRSPEKSRQGLIRCTLNASDGRHSTLKFSRPVHRSEDVLALAVLQLDYAALRKRVAALNEN